MWTTPSLLAGLEFVLGAKDGPNRREARQQEYHDHGETDNDVDVGNTVEAPAEAADEIHDGIEQRHLLPKRRQHVDGIEAAAQEGERGDHHQRNNLQLLKPDGPDADQKSK